MGIPNNNDTVQLTSVLNSATPTITAETNVKDEIPLPNVPEDFFDGPVRRKLNKSKFLDSLILLYTSDTQKCKYPHNRLLSILFDRREINVECEKLLSSRIHKFIITITIDGLKFQGTDCSIKKAKDSAARVVFLHVKSPLEGPPTDDDFYRLARRGNNTYALQDKFEVMKVAKKHRIEDFICDTAENKFAYETQKRGLDFGNFDNMTAILEIRKEESGDHKGMVEDEVKNSEVNKEGSEKDGEVSKKGSEKDGEVSKEESESSKELSKNENKNRKGVCKKRRKNNKGKSKSKKQIIKEKREKYVKQKSNKFRKIPIDESQKCNVIAFATGTKLMNHEYLNNDGTSILVSHSEVLARRGFLRYLYNQILQAKNGNSDSIFSYIDGKFTLKDGITFHLYTRNIPCGHAKIYANQHNRKTPEAIKGILRTTLLQKYQGKGTIKYQGSQYKQSHARINQKWKGIKVMTCSDKILRMNVLGIQGALLTYFINPIYFSTIVIHEKHDLNHSDHAFYGRIEKDFPELPLPYAVHKPDVIKCYQRNIYNDMNHKCMKYNINWNIADEVLEETSSLTGFQSNGEPSRLCKRRLFELFHKLIDYEDDLFQPGQTYSKYKKKAKSYKYAKEIFYDYLFKNELGTWIQAPGGIDDFIM